MAWMADFLVCTGKPAMTMGLPRAYFPANGAKASVRIS
jgi:hypothetical protein